MHRLVNAVSFFMNEITYTVVLVLVACTMIRDGTRGDKKVGVQLRLISYSSIDAYTTSP